MDALNKFCAIFNKGDKFCDFLFAFLYIDPLLIRDLLQTERIYYNGEQVRSC